LVSGGDNLIGRAVAEESPPAAHLLQEGAKDRAALKDRYLMEPNPFAVAAA
jgi:hypothetical protein